MTSKGSWDPSTRLAALRRFAVAITILNLVGHAYLGFEQSLAQPLVALGTAYGVELLLEAVGAWSQGQRPKFAEG
jgi:enediyne biosynthesis protein E5